MLAAIGTHQAVEAVIVALVLALAVWLICHIVAPAYEAVAFILTLVLVLLILLFL